MSKSLLSSVAISAANIFQSDSRVGCVKIYLMEHKNVKDKHKYCKIEIFIEMIKKCRDSNFLKAE